MPHSSKQVKIVNRRETYKLYASGGLQIEEARNSRLYVQSRVQGPGVKLCRPESRIWAPTAARISPMKRRKMRWPRRPIFKLTQSADERTISVVTATTKTATSSKSISSQFEAREERVIAVVIAPGPASNGIASGTSNRSSADSTLSSCCTFVGAPR